MKKLPSTLLLLMLWVIHPFISITQTTDYELLFNSATSDYVEISSGSAVIANKTAFTISGWVNPQLDNSHSGLFGFRNNTDADFYLLQLQNTNNVEARFRNSIGIQFDIIGTNLLDFNQWQHLAFSYDGSWLRLYKNGNLIDSTSANGTIIQTSESFMLGASSWQGSFFHMTGRLDEIRLFDVALSKSTINNWLCHEINTSHPYYNNLMGYWNLNDGSGNIVSDLSVNANHGIIIGNTTWQVSSSNIVNNVMICYGDSIVVGNNTYNISGSYVDSFTATTGCDSIIITNLTISPSFTPQIIQIGQNLSATTTGGASPYSYFWSTFSTLSNIAPLQNGQYWVLMTDANGCVSDTAYFNVTFIPTSIQQFNDHKEKPIKIVNLLGKETLPNKHQILLFIYSDGSIEKKIFIE